MLSHSRRAFLGGLAAFAFVGQSPASERMPFDKRTFESLNASGAPILVHVTADWCEVCQAQKPIVADLLSQPDLAGVAYFNVDFDAQKEVLRDFRVQYQSTMIVFRDGKELGRATGETDPRAIEELVRMVC
jgi:thiol-disulfide isomerase/thioredoxin